MNNNIGAFPLRTSPIFLGRLISTNNARIRSTKKMLRSKGFPSRNWSAPDICVGDCNQADGAREPAINSHATGIQSALEVRTVGSRFRRNRHTIPAAKTILASPGFTHCLPRRLARVDLASSRTRSREPFGTTIWRGTSYNLCQLIRSSRSMNLLSIRLCKYSSVEPIQCRRFSPRPIHYLDADHGKSEPSNERHYQDCGSTIDMG